MLLAAVLFFGILTLWVEARWALAVFQVALLGIAAAKLADAIRRGNFPRVHPVAALLSACVVWGFIQAATGATVYQSRTQEATLDWLVSLAAFALALEISRQRDERERFLRYALIFATLLGLAAIFTLLTSPPGKAFWVFSTSVDVPTLGPFVYKNQYAAFVELVLPIALFGAIRDRRHWLPYTGIAAMLFGSVVAAGSRAGSVLCFLEILIVPAIAFARGRINRLAFVRALAASLVLATALVPIIGWQTLWNRFQEATPYALRANLLASSVQMVRERPWAGFGLGAWSAAYPSYASYDDGTFVNQAHNDWVQWAAEGGIPFFVLALAIAVWVIRPAARSIWAIGLLAVFLHALVDYPFAQRPAFAAFVFALLGLVAAESDRPWRTGVRKFTRGGLCAKFQA